MKNNKIKIYIFLTILNLLFAMNISSQVSEEWVRRYTSTGDNTDVANDIATDGSGNAYVTGYVTSLFGGISIFTIKYSPGGIVLWSHVFDGGHGTDIGYAIAVDGSGNVYVTGNSAGSNNYSDYITIKYNSAGTQLWAARYNGSDVSESAQDIKVDASGNVYVTGFSYGNNTDYATIKYNSAGVEQWVRRYNDPDNGPDEANSLVLDGSGNVYVSGRSYGGSSSNYDYAIVKYNSTGVQQWVQRYNGPASDRDEAYSLAVDGSGNVYVTGLSIGNGSGTDYATIKYNSAGDQQWAKRYNGPANSTEQANSIAVDGSGNVYVTGYSSGGNTSLFDYATIKYNSSGVQQWVQRYNGPGSVDDKANALALDISGNIYVTGFSLNGTISDYLTLKYSPAGTQIWERRYNSTGSDNGKAIAITNTGIVYVTGISDAPGSGSDFLTIKYSQTVGIENTGSEIPAEFSLGQNYPNPFNPMTNISLNIAKLGFVSVKVYDISGREVAVLVNENLSAGVYNVDFDGSNLASGTYFYKLETNGFTDVKKMILVK